MSPLPVRNDPLGALHGVPDRGELFGNRGILHGEDGAIVRGWTSRAWISCALAFRGQRREILPAGGYTGLFFRDEATALAAGHRPCFLCRRADAVAYVAALGGVGSARALDAALHDERLVERAVPRRGVGAQRRLHVIDDADALPVGVVVRDASGLAVRTGDGWRAWSFGALGPEIDVRPGSQLVTPPTSVAALRGGYAPASLPLAG